MMIPHLTLLSSKGLVCCDFLFGVSYNASSGQVMHFNSTISTELGMSPDMSGLPPMFINVVTAPDGNIQALAGTSSQYNYSSGTSMGSEYRRSSHGLVSGTWQSFSIELDLYSEDILDRWKSTHSP